MSMSINKSNYGFLLSDNKYVKHLIIDGYEVGGLALDSININVAIDNNKTAVAWFSEDIKKKFNLNPNDYKKELNEAAELLKEAIETKCFNLFSFPHDDVYDKNNNKINFLNKQNIGGLEFLNIHESIDTDIPIISGVYCIDEKNTIKCKMTKFEQTIQSLNMISFIKDFSKLQVVVSLK